MNLQLLYPGGGPSVSRLTFYTGSGEMGAAEPRAEGQCPGGMQMPTWMQLCKGVIAQMGQGGSPHAEQSSTEYEMGGSNVMARGGVAEEVSHVRWFSIDVRAQEGEEGPHGER